MFDLVFVIFTSFSKSRDPAMAMPAVLEKFYSQMWLSFMGYLLPMSGKHNPYWKIPFIQSHVILQWLGQPYLII